MLEKTNSTFFLADIELPSCVADMANGLVSLFLLKSIYQGPALWSQLGI